MIVLDASALVDVVLDHPTAPWVLEQLAGQEVCAPVHQPAEVLSAVARLRRAGSLDPATAESAMAEAAALHQELVLPTTDHLLRALRWDGRLRVLDALYVVLAEEREQALVTTDRRLARAGVGCEVRAPGG